MNTTRRQQALQLRIAAAELAANRPHETHVANRDEQKFRRKGRPSHLASFTKGLPHEKDTGLIENPDDFQAFVRGVDSGDPADFVATRLGPDGEAEKPKWCSNKANNAGGKGVKAKVRGWESQGAGLLFDLEGPDAQAVTMPPAPEIGSDELTAEIAEVYAQALLRDVPFEKIVDGTGEIPFKGHRASKVCATAHDILLLLNKLPWFQDDTCKTLNDAERKRKRGQQTRQTLFRGITPGDNIGPYISQFLLAGTSGINGRDNERSPQEGFIDYGALRISQQVRFATPCDDHMTSWFEWLDVQNGADLRGLESYESKPPRRFITTPRDLATYVHYDALYEAYLNACLILLNKGIPFDPGIPFQLPDFQDHQQGFVHFGGPHILSLLTEVATRALKAVRFQKFNVHRRLRPEALAGRLSKSYSLNVPELNAMIKQLSWAPPKRKSILELISHKNGPDRHLPKDGNFLLPMAFCEGSPMHPSYGAGHATVAGACVTILKAFFDHGHLLDLSGKGPNKAFVPDLASNGTKLKVITIKDGPFTVEGELNKLASNISIGRDWAGVHYFTDYIESIRMGEQVALGILEEQKLTYGENFSMTVPLFDGGTVRI